MSDKYEYQIIKKYIRRPVMKSLLFFAGQNEKCNIRNMT